METPEGNIEQHMNEGDGDNPLPQYDRDPRDPGNPERDDEGPDDDDEENNDDDDQGEPEGDGDNPPPDNDRYYYYSDEFYEQPFPYCNERPAPDSEQDAEDNPLPDEDKDPPNLENKLAQREDTGSDGPTSECENPIKA